MPRVAIDYSKTIMYRIICKDPTITDCYVGSTINFTKRKGQHKQNCNNENDKNHNYYVYRFIRNNGGFENWEMIEIEKYNAIDKAEQARRERYWLEFYKASLNKNIPSRPQLEYQKVYRDNNRDKIKEYTENNKEHKKEYNEIYYDVNKDQILKTNEKYRKLNKELITNNNKNYREKNRELIREKDREKSFCNICNIIYSKSNMSQHKKSKKHQLFLLNIVPSNH